MHEVAALVADFPDAFVRFAPEGFQGFQNLFQQRCRRTVIVRRQAHAFFACVMKRTDQLAIHIELELIHRAVADAHRAGMFIAGQPVRFPFLQAAFAGNAVQRLQLIRRTGNGALDPIAKCRRFVAVPGLQQRDQREHRIAQPAVAIVPVTGAAQMLRQRGSGRGDDAAGGQITQPLQHHQRAAHLLGPWPDIGTAARPAVPERGGALQCLFGVDQRRRGLMGCAVAEQEPGALPFAQGEVGFGAHVLAAQRLRRTQGQLIGAGDGADTIDDTRHPWHGAAVVEAEGQAHVHGHAALHAAHDTHQMLMDFAVFAGDHEVDQFHRAAVGDHARAQHQTIVLVGALGTEVGGRRQRPLPVLLIAQQRSEHRIGIEAWQAQPADGAAVVDQGRAVAVAQHGVILDTHAHWVGASFRRKNAQSCMGRVGIRLRLRR